MATELICVLADIHGGSSTAVLPPNFRLVEGNQHVEQNKIQAWLWARMQEALQFADAVAAGDKWHLVLNGDLIDGYHHKTKQVISTDLDDHVNAAAQVLKPWAERADKVFITEGTECHVGNVETNLGKALHAEENSDTGRFSFPRLDILLKDTPMTFYHHMPTSGRPWTEATPMGTVLAAEQLEAARNGEAIPKVVCTAHAHIFREFNNGTGMAVCSPAWQMHTRFTGKVVPWARCKPGVFLLDMREVEPGELPRLHYRTFRAPTSGRIVL